MLLFFRASRLIKILACSDCSHMSINHTVAATCCVKEKLSWRQTREVRILHKPFGFGTVIVLYEVRKSAALKPKWDSLSLHSLLPDATHDLSDIDF